MSEGILPGDSLLTFRPWGKVTRDVASADNSHDYRHATTAQDIDFVRRAEQQGFLCSAADADRYIEQVGTDGLRILWRGSQPVGSLVILEQAQWWLGSRIPMAGIASVSIVPEARRQGNAAMLMQRTLEELYDAGVPLSALYSAATPLYHRMGYGVGGTSGHWHAPVYDIGVTDVPLAIQPMALATEQMRPIQQRYAQYHSGHLDRHGSIWTRIVVPSGDRPESFAYSIGPAEGPQGYIVLSLDAGPPATVNVLDWAAVTASAGRSLWGFLARMGSQLEVVRWRGGAIDPMVLLLPDQTAEIQHLDYWMLRLVNVPKALEARPYPVGATATLSFEVLDEVLPANQGRWTLTVSDRRGTVTSGGDGSVVLPVSSLASLYAGLLSPYQLRQMGRLEGADGSLAIAAALFAGPCAWMPDFF